ncbi:UV-endonuclease UvdE-domain-containing protein [Fusarium flagelliforme]|uniref:Putative uv-endonuclease uve-1 n=1 Tax=Fusarium flagelliforme TaxID=2675880 RepID=A0A395MH93_9HYPO|nr:UV-endonuclease UvdE-domain-containing protein [Fusarium flagelliforme]KAH7169800.1 UV-endonuclease UvdE-domain-containing protein [Fusarium flagelliforme]RFN47267.1 putative uv-endonuclease uve-1 [Fusarium flagelliforme]
MASKRKRAGSHLPLPAPEQPGPPRRSSRRLKDVATNSTTTNEQSSDNMGIGSTVDVNSPNDQTSSRKTKIIGDIDESAEEAMRELSKMEYKLQNAARKERLAVEASDLHVEEDDNVTSDIRSKIHSPEKEILPTTRMKKADRLERAPLGGHEAELAMAGSIGIEYNEGLYQVANRPPPVNSDRLPLPWSGRLGYACLNTYLRNTNPPVFSSRTCPLASILKRGQKYVQELGLANARDIIKMIQWNHKYGINFMRLSSGVFPFASHEEYGYNLAPFAADVLAEAGKVAAELGHRLTMHPGQFTQIGSPRKEVVASSVRDLDYHDEMLSLLKLPEQMDRDAVMVLHMGGVYGGKEATLNRFRENYAKLSDSVKRRLVLENDDVAWSVHDLLPICEELNIPLVLDYHHHNIIFDPCLREGTKDIIGLYDRIKKTWTRKRITQKMHYNEQTASAVSPRERRKHSARVKTLPPCDPDMDLMIEANDKEQAVFELMRTFKLPGWDSFNDIVPYEREDELRKPVKKEAKKGKKKTNGVNGDTDNDIGIPERIVSAEDFGMGGPNNRVYWPEGMVDWLRPKK